LSSLDFTFWDVQHGNATHIRTPNGRNVVIDLGDGESTLLNERFSPLMALSDDGVTVIDKLVITHPHRDHLDDMDNLDNFNVETLLRPRWLTETEVRGGNKPADANKVRQYLAFSNRFNQTLAPKNEGGISANWGGTAFRYYMSKAVPRANLNNHSIVTVAEFAGLKALIPGDNEATSWMALLEQQQFVNELAGVDIFLAPHHGREAGFCSDLFDAGLCPRLTIISDDQAGSTSVTAKYAARTRGWGVYIGGASTSEERWCVTTRSDGTIRVKLGLETSGKKFIRVDTEY
jgi:beta-lactamase superfamily II metal-dependent hydrolase